MNALFATEKVDFYGDTLFAAKQDDGPPLIAVKPMVERIGIDWEGQRQRIQRDQILSGSTFMIKVETPAGERETVALPLNLIPGFLFGIDDSRIPDPDIRKLVLAYKRHCHDVLYQHFFGKPNRSAESSATDDLYATNTKLRMVEAATKLRGKAAAMALWAELGLPPLAGQEAAPRTGALQGIDFVRQFLTACTAEAPGGRVQASELKRKYDQWALDEKAPYMTAKAFAMCLDSIGISKAKAHNHYYLGIRILHLNEVAH